MAAQQLATRTARAPPEPEFVLRGHSHAVTALRFLDEQRLVSGDVGGHCLLWNLATRRPVQNWAAAPLGVLELPRARRRPAHADARRENTALGPGEFSRADDDARDELVLLRALRDRRTW